MGEGSDRLRVNKQVEEMQRVLDQGKRDLDSIDALRLRAEGVAEDFEGFLVALYRKAFVSETNQPEDWAMVRGVRVALIQIPDFSIREAVEAEIKHGTFGKQNLLGLCQHSMNRIVLMMSRIKLDKSQLTMPWGDAGNVNLHRMTGGAREKVTDPYHKE